MRIAADGTATEARRSAAQVDHRRSRPARRTRSPMPSARRRMCGSPTARADFAEERRSRASPLHQRACASRVARYNGVTLHWVGHRRPPVDLEWKGAHPGVTFSPDGRYLVTAMQENALHGWKLERARRNPPHAHDRLPCQGEVDLLVGQGQMARLLRRARRHRLALPAQGRADGQGAAANSAPAPHAW